jgi:hypothetical protein
MFWIIDQVISCAEAVPRTECLFFYLEMACSFSPIWCGLLHVSPQYIPNRASGIFRAKCIISDKFFIYNLKITYSLVKPYLLERVPTAASTYVLLYKNSHLCQKGSLNAKLSKSLKMAVVTRWNSNLRMLLSFELAFDELKKYLIDICG